MSELEAGGMMVVVVGPSGAGKDTLMAIAARHFDGRKDVHFVRRVITRDADAGGEDHTAISEGGFDALLQAHGFAVHWEAHGLKYGIPAAVFDELKSGHLVIANGSRSVLDRFKTAFPRLTVLSITARPEVLAERLEARGRETREDILKRLQRSALAIDGDYDVVTIDNSDALEEAGGQLVDALERILGQPSAGAGLPPSVTS
jgi:ribose 1,5-bisphosphokinase